MANTDYKAKRIVMWRASIILVWGGLLLLLIDMTTPFPTAARGAYAMWWILVSFLGFIFYLLSKQLPLEEALDLAKEMGGELAVHDVMDGLWVTAETAQMILTKLEKKYAKREQRGDAVVWIFPDITERHKPAEKVLLLAKKHSGELTVSKIIDALNINIEEAETTLAELEEKGYCIKHHENDATFWIFPSESKN